MARGQRSVGCGCLGLLIVVGLITATQTPPSAAPWIVIGVGALVVLVIIGAVMGDSETREVPSERGALEEFYSKVAGVSFRRRAVKKARVGDELTLVREPDNPADPYAVAVFLKRTNQQIGYIVRGRARVMSSQMKGGAEYYAEVKDVTGGGLFKERGINIVVRLVGWTPAAITPRNPEPEPLLPQTCEVCGNFIHGRSWLAKLDGAPRLVCFDCRRNLERQTSNAAVKRLKKKRRNGADSDEHPPTSPT